MKERLHCSVHHHEGPDRVAVSQKRMLRVFIERAERLFWELDEPTTCVALAISVTTRGSLDTITVSHFHRDEVVILIMLDANMPHVIGPGVLHKRVKELPRDPAGFEGTLHVGWHRAVSVHVYFEVLGFVLLPAVNIAVVARVDQRSVVACLCAISAVVASFLPTNTAGLPRHVERKGEISKRKMGQRCSEEHAARRKAGV